MVYGAGRGGDLVNLTPAVAIGFVGLDCVSLVDSYCFVKDGLDFYFECL